MFGAIAGGIASALAGGAMSKLFGGGQKAASGGFFFSSRRRHTSFDCDWNSDVCSSDLPDHPLLPNYKFVPIGYHGRASSIVASEAPIRRPWGQIKGPDQPHPAFVPTRMLDFELEVGVYEIGRASCRERVEMSAVGESSN